MNKVMNDQPLLPSEGIIHHAEGVDLLPSSIALAGTEVSLVNAMSRESTLKQVINIYKKDYDYILIDCMPSLGMMTVNALVAADSGMADIVHIIEQSRNALVSGGFLLLEHGWQQGEAVRQAFILAGYHDVETCRDYGDNERVTLGRYYQ